MKNKDTYISASEFKKNCLNIVDQINKEHNSVVITKRKIPIAKVVPLDKKSDVQNYFGFLKGSVTIKDDIVNYSSESDWDTCND